MTGDDGEPERTFAAALAAGDRAALGAAGVRRAWPDGAVLFREGDRADRVLLLVSGTVKVVTTSSAGVERILALRTTGDLVGELAAVDGRPRSATAVATGAVEALVVSASTFRTFLAERPAAALEVLTVAIGHLRDADRQRAEFGTADATARLARVLADLSRRHGRQGDAGVRIDLLSQDELAALCGASREAVSRALRTLRAAGLVATARRSVTVRDLGALDAWES